MSEHPVVLQMFGRDTATYDVIDTGRSGSRSAASLSVGAAGDSPSLQFKGASDEPNEDALCVIDRGHDVLMAVADAHFGTESSHQLIERLADRCRQIPRDLAALHTVVAGLAQGERPRTDSESTLLVAVLNRDWGQGFGLSFGDSTIALISPAGRYTQLNTKDHRYVRAGRRSALDRGTPFSFTAEAPEVLVMHTDGIDECHYRQPDTSVRPTHVAELVRRFPSEPDRLANELAQLGLDGVGGSPGGQDNIAVIASLA